MISLKLLEQGASRHLECTRSSKYCVRLCYCRSLHHAALPSSWSRILQCLALSYSHVICAGMSCHALRTRGFDASVSRLYISGNTYTAIHRLKSEKMVMITSKPPTPIEPCEQYSYPGGQVHLVRLLSFEQVELLRAPDLRLYYVRKRLRMSLVGM